MAENERIEEEAEMTFGNTLRLYRQQSGLSQSDLAEKSGISVRTIQAWELDYRAPVSLDFFRLVRSLNLSADAFASITERERQRGKKRKSKPARNGKAKK